MNTFKTIFATLAATAVLAGCAKEITSPSSENDKVTPDAEGSRVITVAFAPQTKTELDGFQPKFVDNDSILISNGVAIDTCDVKVESEVATISTNLTGPLTAVYPYKAAGMSDSNPNQIDTVLVSTEQDGTFASANICMTEISENATAATFENKTAVFCIKPAAGASSEYVEVKAEGFNIANDYPEGSTFTTCNTIHVAPVTTDSVYVSILVLDGLKVNNLKFSDGTQEKAITTGARAAEAIAAGTLYTVTATDWASPEADTPDGALNGVFSVSADKQVYFSRGNMYWDGSAFKFEANQHEFQSSWNENHVSLFFWSRDASVADAENYKDNSRAANDVFFTNATAETAKSDFTINGVTGKYRTLSKNEWIYLFNTRTVNGGTGEGKSYQRATINSNETSVYGMILYPDGYTSQTAAASYTSTEWELLENAGCVFLPAGGCRDGSNFLFIGSSGPYWSSSALDVSSACGIGFSSEEVLPDSNGDRNAGCSVRLVTDVPAAPGPTEPDYVVITAKYDGEDNPDRPLKWSRQNLAITDSGNKKWKGENDTAVKVPGTNEDVIVGDYFQWAAYAGYCGNATATDKGLLIYTSFTNRYLVSGGSENKFEVKSNAEGKEYKFNTGSDDTYVGIAPYYSGSNFEYPSGSINLGKTDDVANIILGDDWRMPTSAEFKAMKDATYWAWDDDDEGYYVYIPVSGDEGGHNGKKSDTETDITGSYNKDNALLFFPAAGQGLNTDISGAHFFGYYWSSTFYLTHTYYAYNLYISESAVFPQHHELRYSGLSIRPVSD